jgi:hypothetical protein
MDINIDKFCKRQKYRVLVRGRCSVRGQSEAFSGGWYWGLRSWPSTLSQAAKPFFVKGFLR